MSNDLVYRLRVLLGRKRFDGELDEELAYHLEREVEEHRRAGVPDVEAIRRARLSLGGLEQVRQQVREGGGVRLAWVVLARGETYRPSLLVDSEPILHGRPMTPA